MILDAIIVFFASLIELLSAALGMLFIPVINLAAAAVEAVVGIFISGFALGRMERKKRPGTSLGGILTLLVLLGVIGWLFVIPRVMNRKVTLVADDGHSMPFAALVIHTKEGDQHLRTKNDGTALIPRFATRAMSIRDPRYVENTWQRAEIGRQVVASRTILGAELDSFADRLLKPVRKREEP